MCRAFVLGVGGKGVCGKIYGPLVQLPLWISQQKWLQLRGFLESLFYFIFFKISMLHRVAETGGHFQSGDLRLSDFAQFRALTSAVRDGGLG